MPKTFYLSGFSKLARLTLALVAIVSLAALTGCAGQHVELKYNPVGSSMSAVPGLPTVMVSEFQNNTGQQYIGADSDGEPFEGTSSPTAWVSEAIADELVRSGVRARYTPYSSYTSEYTIKGTLDQLWLEQTGPGQYKARIAITIEFPQNADRAVVKRSYNSEQSSFMLPSDSNVSELMESVLRDVATRAANEIKTTIPRI